MNSLSDIIGSLGSAAGDVLGGLRGKKNDAPSPFANNPAATGTGTAAAWMPYAIGGAILIVVLVLFASFRKR